MAAGSREWPACSIHGTPEQNDEHRVATLAQLEELERPFRDAFRALPVECWSWPAIERDLERAAQITACADPFEAFSLSRQLLTEWQRGRCAVCKALYDVVDHDHTTALVRGLLCQSCNLSEPGGGPEDRFGRYRLKNPASILGLRVRYFSPIAGWAEPDAGPEGADLDRSPGYLLASYLTDGDNG